MSAKNKKQFGIWMDSHQATIVGRQQNDSGDFVILAHEKNSGQGSNSNENASNNAERTLQQKFFKGITAHMQNVEEVHVTGTGQVQEQFIKYMADSPQFKNTVAKESTANQMTDEKLVDYITKTFH
jgi:stalled ribosome rescue protein Dom34